MSGSEATTYADPLVLGASLAGARAGQSFIYAAGPVLDPRHPTAQLVSAERAAGRARTHLQGRDLQGRQRYSVVKLDPEPSDKPVVSAAQAARLKRSELALLNLLAGAARRGEACPSLRSIAVALALPDRQAAQYALRRLRQMRLIEIENPSARVRVVRIVSTGLSTAPAAALSTTLSTATTPKQVNP